MADTDPEDHGPGPFNPVPEFARTMIGTAPLFEADSSSGTAILPAIGDNLEARDLVRATQRELEAAAEHPREQARLHHGLAVVFDERLDDPHAALLHYQRACELEPQNRTYLRAALRCYQARQSWTLALGLLDAELELATTPAERARALTDKALIYDDWLAHGAAARELYEQALEADPTNAESLYRLRRLLERLDDRPALLKVCRKAIAATSDRRQRCVLYANVARIQLEELGDEQAAIESYAVAFVEDPANVGVADALLSLYALRGRWGDVVDVLLTTGDLADSDQQRCSRYLTAARICRDRLGQSERALELLERVHYDQLDEQTAQEMVELLRAVGRHEELLALYEQQLAAGQPAGDTAAALSRCRVAELLAGAFERHDEAQAHYRRALEVDPTFLPARHALDASYRQANDAEGLQKLARDELRVLEDPVERAFQLTRMALLAAEHLGNLTEATKLLSKALETVEGFAPARRELVLFYERGGAYQQLLPLLEQEIDVHGASPMSLPLTRMAQLAERELGDLERAADLYRRALEKGSEQVGLLRSLERICAALGRHEERLSLLEREATLATDPYLARHLAHLAASLCEGALQRPDEAEARYREILVQTPTDHAALAALARLYGRRGGHASLVELYLEQLERPFDSNDGKASSWRAGLRCRVAQLLEDDLQQQDRARRQLELALEEDPRCNYALVELTRLQRRRGSWDELYALLRRHAEVSEDGARRAALLQAAGDLCAHCREQPAEALRCYHDALAIRPEFDSAREAALRLLLFGGQLDDAVELLEEGLRHTFERRPRLTLLKRLGALFAQQLDDPQKAAEVLEQGLSLDASDVELLTMLDGVFRVLRDFEGLVANDERLTVCCEEADARLLYMHEAALTVEVQLQGVRDPTALYTSILEIAPRDRRALDALARLYAQRGERDELHRIYEAQLAAETQCRGYGARERRREVLMRLAAVREASGALDGAEKALTAVAAEEEDWLVHRELRRLRERLKRWREVCEALEGEAAASRCDGHVAESLQRAAELYLERFDDAPRAIAALRRILTRLPFHEQAASRLEQLLVQREGWSELVEVVRERLDAAERGARPESGSPLQARIELLVRMAWIQREHLHQPAEAVATLQAAAELDQHHISTLLTLSELQVSLGQNDQAVASFDRVVALSDDPDILLRAHTQLGELFADELGDVRRAISSYQNVLAIAPKDRATLARLHTLFRQVDDWDNAADILTRLLELEPDPERQVDYTIALAEIAEHGFGDPEQAADGYYDALELDPSNERVVDRLIDLLGPLGRWERLCVALRSYLAALPEDQQLRTTARRLQLAEILHRHLARPGEALEQLHAVVEIDPTNIDARLASARLLAEQGRFDEAVAQHREVLDLEPLHRESLAQLRALWARAGLPELAQAAAGVLVVSGLADEPERRLYREHKSVGVRLPQLALDPGLYNSTLLHPAEQHASRAILNVLCEAAHRIRPPDYDRWQVGKSDRLAPRSEDPLKGLVQQLHTCLGLVRDVEIYISHARDRELDLLLTDPPSLVVGSSVLGSFSSRHLRFWMAKLLTYVRNRTWIAYGLDGRQLGTIVVAARRLTDSAASASGLDEGEVVEMSRAIQRSLSRRGRRALDETVRGLRDARAPGYGEWAIGMQLTALRTALWAVNDLEITFEHLRHLDPLLAQATTAEQLGQALRRDRQAAEMMRFWLSDELQTARLGTLRG